MVVRRSLVRSSVVLGLGAFGAWASPSAATAAPPCNAVTHGTTYSSVQAAVAAASPGATVRVKGTCVGDVTITKKLRLVGRSHGHPGATLDGGNNREHPGHVIVIDGATVTIIGLTITGGYTTCPPVSGACNEPSGEMGENGGGIDNEGGSLTLADSTVIANVAAAKDDIFQGPKQGGGGIYSERGSVTLERSTVAHNSGAGEGGGIDNEQGSLRLTDSTISENEVTEGERGISGNPREGGGIYNGGGVVTISRSTISRNSTPEGGRFAFTCPHGGGIDNEGDGSLTLTKSTVSANTAGCSGAGISNSEDSGAGTTTLRDSIVNGNVVPVGAGDEVVFGGGGIFNGNVLKLEGSSSVTDNAANTHGGGIYNAKCRGATLSFGPNWRGTISANSPDDIFDGCPAREPQG